MAQKKLQTMFGALYPNSRAPYIIPQSVSSQAQDVRRKVGEWFNEPIPAAGWIEARKKGYRVVKIEVRAVNQ